MGEKGNRRKTSEKYLIVETQHGIEKEERQIEYKYTQNVVIVCGSL